MRVSWILAGLLAMGQASQLGVNALVAQLQSTDPNAVSDAAKALKERGPEAVTVLVKTLHDNPLCEVQWVVANLLRDMQPEYPGFDATMLTLADLKCKLRFPQDYVLQRQAAFVLANRASSLPLMAARLTSGETSKRRIAVVAFEDLLESLSDGLPVIEATPELVKALKPVLPILAKAAASDSDTPVRCTAYYSLDHAARAAKNPEVKQDAEQAMHGLTKPTCPGK